MQLPERFLTRMKEQLGEEYSSFLKSYCRPPEYGLRINPLKGNIVSQAVSLPFSLHQVFWAPEGFYAALEERPGRHPLHEAGAYYIQEPSAMSVVSLLDPHPGDLVCDLCAAPGGKSTQIGGRLAGQGLLVSNEIIPSRAKILSQNIERMGIGNAVVCNEPPDRMAALFPLFFDRIVVDAPCSGEGMFRKDYIAVQEWSEEQVAICADRQHMILNYADEMLQPGGVLVYSTCTFAPAENEQQISRFLEEHPDYVLEDWTTIINPSSGVSHGTLPGTMRLWPHLIRGDGHFAARLRKTGTPIRQKIPASKKQGKSLDLSHFQDFCKQTLSEEFTLPAGRYQYFGDELYLIPQTMKSLDGIKVLRPGLHLGTRKKNRFEPSHALAKFLSPSAVKFYYDCNHKEAVHFLHGDTLTEQSASAEKPLHGWTLTGFQGYSLGWTKANKGTLKNHYPKGLRIPF